MDHLRSWKLLYNVGTLDGGYVTSSLVGYKDPQTIFFTQQKR